MARKKNRSHDGDVGLSTLTGAIVTSDRGVSGLLKGLCVHVTISQKVVRVGRMECWGLLGTAEGSVTWSPLLARLTH